MTPRTGKVFLVGAGPGDPGLITRRGMECLREADVVLYDYLASPLLLASARADATLVCLGRHGQGRLIGQEEINKLLVEHALAGRSVVRLKGGDSTIFARATEEIGALNGAGVPYEIVPGVTAAQAASSHAGIPLTDRDHASCVAFVTGQETAGKEAGQGLDYGALAQFPGTLVFYMGVTTAPIWSRALVEHGKPATTPVAIARRCSFPDQETIFTTLGELARFGEPGGAPRVRPPAVMIVGEVVASRRLPNWFTSRPLFGRSVLVTRPEEQAAEIAEPLRRLGANVLCQPAIEIGEPRDWAGADKAIERLAEFDAVAFSSANGVRYFMRRLLARGYDLRRLGGIELAAIGPATSAALAEFHLRGDIKPGSYRAEALAGALAPRAAGRRFLLVRASRGRETLGEMLTAAGADVQQAVFYDSRDVTTPAEEIRDALFAGRIDWTTVTSSAIARSLARMFGEGLRQTRLVAISPLTAETLAELGHRPAVVAETYTTAGVVDAIVAATGLEAG